MKLPRISRRKFLGTAGAAATFAVPTLRAAASLAATSEVPSTVLVSIAATPILFDPDQALGSSMDILSHDVVEKIYTEPMVKQCLSAGWGPITYRQNTELSIGAWHWNPNGTWERCREPPRIFCRQRGTQGSNPPFLRISSASPRSYSQRRLRARIFAAHRRESRLILEEQSVSCKQVHRRTGLRSPAVGRD